MQFSLKVEGINDINKELKKYSDDVKKDVARAVLDTVNDIRNDAVLNAPVNTGKLKQSIVGRTSGTEGEVWVGAKHALDVEKGQKPGRWPNVDELMFWVRKKIKPDRKRLKGVTYLVSKKIFEKGTRAQPFFDPAVKKHEKRFIRKVEKALK